MNDDCEMIGHVFVFILYPLYYFSIGIDIYFYSFSFFILVLLMGQIRELDNQMEFNLK